METKTTKLKDAKVAIIGSGNIGRSFAMLFAASGYKVSMHDIKSSQLQDGMRDIKERLHELQQMGLLRGTLTITQQLQRISATDDLGGCIQGAFYVQDRILRELRFIKEQTEIIPHAKECVPEELDLKLDVLSKIDALIDKTTIFTSSTTAILPSLLSEKLKNRNRFLVAHPTNPPFYAPLVEIVPAPWTDSDVTHRTTELMKEIGQSPVILKKEIDGFALNRIQDAIKGECWRLVEILEVEKVNVLKNGLSRRITKCIPNTTISGFIGDVYLVSHGKVFNEALTCPLPQVSRRPLALQHKQYYKEDVISVEDLDKVMTEGLGRRYAFMGPLETGFLNADGFYSYADRYANMIHGLQISFDKVVKQEGELLERVQKEMEALIPMDKLKEQRQWRDIRLARLAKLIRDMDSL